MTAHFKKIYEERDSLKIEVELLKAKLEMAELNYDGAMIDLAESEEQIKALKEKLNMTEIKLRIAKDSQLRTYDGLANKADKFDRFKVYGTSDCKQCETGRITLFYHTDKCIECAPEDYK